MTRDMVEVYAAPGQATMKAFGDVRLNEVFDKPEWRRLGVAVTYQYDMCDDWEHFIHFLGPAEPHLSTAMGLGNEQKVSALVRRAILSTRTAGVSVGLRS